MESKKCPFCDKEIEGYTEKHVESQLNQHIVAKHPEKMRIKSKWWKTNENNIN